MRKVLGALALLLVLLPAIVNADIIPADRMIDWSKAGIPGGIPVRTNICATLNPGATAAQINTAIQNCNNGVVFLNAGSYPLSDTISLNRNNVTLRGAGPGKTILLSTTELMNIGGGDPTNYVDVVSGYQRGSTSMTLASTTFTSEHTSSVSLKLGDYLVIDQENDNTTTVVTTTGSGGTCTWCGLTRCSSNHNIVDSWGSGGACDSGRGTYEGGLRALGQVIKVTAMNGNTITFEPALYWNYVAAAEPHVSRLSGMIEYAGIEDLTINDTYSNSRHTIDMDQCAYCWFKNVELANTSRYGIVVQFAYRNEFRDNYFHHSFCYPGDHGYGISFSEHSTANLVENNIFDNLHVPIAREGGGGGNVYGYNYFDHGRYNLNCDAGAPENVAMPEAIVPHGAHPVFDLTEGNVGYQFGGDSYWGTSSHSTTFRNVVTGYDPTYYENMVYAGYHYRMEAVMALPLNTFQRYMTIVGNVLGAPGVSTTYEMNGTNSAMCWTYTATNKYIYHLGYVSAWDCSSPRDMLTRSTLLRHANFDYVTNSIKYCNDVGEPGCQGGDASHTLPASLYLSAKPSWWGSLPWPAIGPDVNPMNGTIPAQIRFNQIMSDNVSSPPIPPVPAVAGDLNGDSKVDITDLSIVAINFGLNSTNPRFNATIDVAVNGQIDIADLVFVARRYTG
jgi:hypothetical protein